MRRLRALALPLAAVAVMVLAFRAPLPYFTERPGSLFGLSRLVRVEGFAEPLRGEVLFGTINVRSATLVAAVAAAFDPHVQLIRRERLLPEGLDSRAFFEQQRAEFALAADVAAAVALSAAGLRVDPDALRGEGAVVLRVERGGPVGERIQAGDVVVAVNGRPVTTDTEYRDAVARSGWNPVSLRVRRGGREAEVQLAPAATRSGRPSIGLVVSTHRPQVDLPVAVGVDNDRVGGPSAGLAVALTVYDLTAPEDLLAGRSVLATGTVDTAGRVGPIGGVGLKAVAARRAGVDLMLVPAAQLDEARGAVGDDAGWVVGVSTFTEALAALRGQTSSVAAASVDAA